MPFSFLLLPKTWITPQDFTSVALILQEGQVIYSLLLPISEHSLSPEKDSEVTNHFTHYPSLSKPFMRVLHITAVPISEVHFQFLGHLAPANVPSPSLLLLIIHSDFSIPTATILIPWLPSS